MNGGSWIGWALGWLMPDDSTRAFVASRSASSERFSDGIASGAPPSAPMAGGATVAGGAWTGLGWRAGVPAGGLFSGAYDPSTFWASDSMPALSDWPASWATFCVSLFAAASSSIGRRSRIEVRIRSHRATISGLGSARFPRASATAASARAAVSATGSATAPRAASLLCSAVGRSVARRAALPAPWEAPAIRSCWAGEGSAGAGGMISSMGAGASSSGAPSTGSAPSAGASVPVRAFPTPSRTGSAGTSCSAATSAASSAASVAASASSAASSRGCGAGGVEGSAGAAGWTCERSCVGSAMDSSGRTTCDRPSSACAIARASSWARSCRSVPYAPAPKYASEPRVNAGTPAASAARWAGGSTWTPSAARSTPRMASSTARAGSATGWRSLGCSARLARAAASRSSPTRPGSAGSAPSAAPPSAASNAGGSGTVQRPSPVGSSPTPARCTAASSPAGTLIVSRSPSTSTAGTGNGAGGRHAVAAYQNAATRAPGSPIAASRRTEPVGTPPASSSMATEPSTNGASMAPMSCGVADRAAGAGAAASGSAVPARTSGGPGPAISTGQRTVRARPGRDGLPGRGRPPLPRQVAR